MLLKTGPKFFTKYFPGSLAKYRKLLGTLSGWEKIAFLVKTESNNIFEHFRQKFKSFYFLSIFSGMFL